MEQKINVRSIVEEDWKFLKEWYLHHGQHTPDRNLLPENGLGGLIVEKDKKPLAATFIYYTNSDVAWLDNGISTLHYEGEFTKEESFEIGNILIKACVKKAEAMGFEVVRSITDNKTLLRRFKTLDWSIKENMNYCTKYIYNGK